MNINNDFARLGLKITHQDVKREFPEVSNVTRAASVMDTGRDQYFVQIETPGRPIFNIDVRACDRWEARAKAWHQFLCRYAPDYE